MALSGSLEDNCLAALCWHERLAPQIALKIKVSDFSTQTYRRIAEVALNFIQSHGKPGRTHIRDILEADIKRGNDGRFMDEVLHEMENRLASQLNEEFVLGELDKFLQIQRLTNAIDEASDFLRSGDLDHAREVLRAPNLLPIDNPGVWLRDTEKWLSFLRDDEEQDLFSSGIDALDEKNVRPARGEMFVLLGVAGTGKSWFLTNCGKHNAISERRNVLHITLENSLDITLQRYTQCLLSLTRDEAKSVAVRVFEDPTHNETQTKVLRLTRPTNPTKTIRDNPVRASVKSIGKMELAKRLVPFQHRGQLLIKHFPMNALTIGMLVNYLDALERLENFRPDMVIIDYMTLMALDSRDIRVSIGQLCRNLRGLASMRNFAFVTVAQARREARDHKTVTSKDVAEDWSIVQTADTFVCYSQTAQERQRNMARILVDKARNSADRWLAWVTQQYEIGQFHLDSYYFSAALKQELDEIEKVTADT